MPRSTTLLLGLLSVVIFTDAGRAVELRVSGNVLYLSGPIRDGDQFKFRDFIVDKNIQFINLKSGGGRLIPAGEIGRQIRNKKISTVVDATNNLCGSACTVLFASGVNRYYLNAQNIKDYLGSTKKGKGLAYHHASGWGRDGKRGQLESGTAQLINWYYEFGTPKASDLAVKAGWKNFYYISADTALALGIATSVSKPK